MKIDTDTMVSITEANENFSKVARLVDEHSTAVILKNNVPRYFVIDFSKAYEDSGGIWDEGLLYFALESPFQSFSGEELYPSIQAKAASLYNGLVKSHAMIDDHVIKRTEFEKPSKIKGLALI